MKYTLAFLAALAGTAIANDESLVIQDDGSNTINGYAAQVPICANLCIFQAAVAVGCDTDDYHCQCSPSKQDQLLALTHNCLDKSCNPAQAKDAFALTNKICNAVKRGLPVLKRSPEPAPVPEPVPAPFPEPAPEAFPEPVIPDEVVAAYLARRGAETGCGAPSPTTVQTVTQASSIPSASLIPSPTATTSPSSVATAGASLHRAPAVAVAGAAVAVAALLL
ncbi:hypothetical protein Sste5346_008478 [Sporothrix stenoceras]|uniref:CFEM domain-containing protein n=1 Tax=Sporothrix stenoceras TaxID=5173 RepID=A0ABR3YP80_9PEZI